MTWTLRYLPGTPLGTKFPSWRFGRFRSELAAECSRRMCANPDQIEAVEVDA